MNNKPALILYFIACLVFMISIVFDSNELMLLSKPIIAPAILFYYLQEKKRDFSWYYIIITALFFIGDMVVLIDLKNLFITIVSIFFIAYLLFLKGLLDDLVTIRLKFMNKTHLFSVLLCTFFLVYLLMSSLDILIETKTPNLWLLVLYGIVLVLIGIISSLNYIFRTSRYTTFMILASLSFVISDVFYILKNYFNEIEIFNYLNNLTQVLSYYFLTKYFILKKS
jgi:YhhN-like protein